MKTKKYLKIASLAVVAAIFIWTFVFLYRKSQPTVKVYETIVPETADLEKTTVATGKVEPRDEVLIKPQISGIISEVYKAAGQSVKQGEVIAKVKVITSPFFIFCPASLYTSSMIPEICGLIRISSRGSIFPVATVVFFRSVISAFNIVYTLALGCDF